MGSCEYKTVLGEKLESALMRAEVLPTRFDPVVSSGYKPAGATLKAAIDTIVTPIYDRYEKDEAAAQAPLDRPDPYEAVCKRCAGWK